jgi:hypothetical protein
MKILLIAIVLLSTTELTAGPCNFASGGFKTVLHECTHTTDGKTFVNEGHKAINAEYYKNTEQFVVTMNVGSNSEYQLRYIVDGKEHKGRPMFEGDTYAAECDNNGISIRAVSSDRKYPMVTLFLTTAKRLLYKQSFEGDPFLRICYLERNK